MLITRQGGLPYKSDGDDRRKSKIRPLKETILKAPGVTIFFSLYTALSDTWVGKFSDFLSQTPQVWPKSAIYVYTPKRDDEHLCHFYMGHGIPPSPKVYTDLHHSQCCHFSFLSCLIVKILVKEIFSRQCFIGFMGSSLDLGHIFENTSITYF